MVSDSFVRLANGEANSSESDNGENTADSSESEDGGDGAIAVFALAFLAGAFFACTALAWEDAASGEGTGGVNGERVGA